MENFEASYFPFFEDDLFIKWVYHPNDSLDEYWEEWMKKNPGRAGDLLGAKRVAISLAKAQNPVDAELLSREIWGNINSRIEQPVKVVHIARASHKKTNLMMAASVAALLVITSALYYFSSLNGNKISNSTPSIARSFISNKLQHTNTSSESRIVYLVDGSKITLQPGASIRHAVFLEKDKREVYLDGDAFFEVAKDANRPFYVYAHDIVLRVLGTSFNVATNKDNGNVTVLVKTGKVSVYKSGNRNKPEFILTPNQSVRYTAQTQSIVQSESDAPLSIPNLVSPHPFNFNFEETPVAKVFAVLEEAYGIRIQYDEKLFSKCIITTSLNDETFDEKLKIICEAISASYKFENNEVIIDGNGCK